ncbi:MAG: cysteine--tRNA ligase [Verrucomicrobiae bacterium]|nr:cysteine--tRNA ligase [Verrucomicrobiae bacterium]
MELYDTLSRTIRTLQPHDGHTFKMYCCGPTVYGRAHIGNFRTFILQDLLRRVLTTSGIQVLHLRNITDVDDKTIRQAIETGQPLKTITDHWTKLFHEDALALNLLPPHIEASAVAHIPQQIDFIRKLLEKKHAYITPDHSVYFRVASFPQYGRLSRLDQRQILTQTLIESDEYQRENAADFALWKARKPEDGPYYWPSPWGEGRPGWHIECSAMACYHLGETIDLHAGGEDLIFPHHENEIAQSECCTGKTFALHWFHTAHLLVEGQKMSKSLGNLYTLEDIKARGYSPNETRYLLLSAHYRQPLNFTWDALHAARCALERLAEFAESIPAPDDLGPQTCSEFGRFTSAWQALQSDLNTPSALGLIFTTLKQIPKPISAPDQQGFVALCRCLGIDPWSQKKSDSNDKLTIPDEVCAIAEKRWQARLQKDWATADKMRQQLLDMGWKVQDDKDRYTLIPITKQVK